LLQRPVWNSISEAFGCETIALAGSCKGNLILRELTIDARGFAACKNQLAHPGRRNPSRVAEYLANAALLE
jgi:hypothetical protein